MSTPHSFCARTAALSALSALLDTDASALQARLEAGEDLASLLAERGVGLEALSAELEEHLAPGLTA
ncbi:hypothetical protein FHN55_06000 [Streptomyces sp. NP160]|uniref:hypothetical protein n=1 Tax=Streptomyces sp. NP160 TaxID=2586637 RepID=UPI00111AC6DF|nr:hypothetical protein [Streptomyces sp. NP160]TNM68760.1 hypothetical protein FHN55_06000 [Streptomyces sp. NP160]